MGWVKEALNDLAVHGRAQVRPFGGSMRGRIESGQLVTLESVGDQPLAVDEAVFVYWKGGYILHLIKEVREDKLLIGNNLGKINGWVRRRDVLARVVKVED